MLNYFWFLIFLWIAGADNANATFFGSKNFSQSAAQISICPGPGSADSFNGTLTSPNYPLNYTNNLNCYFYISLPPKANNIQVNVDFIDLENGRDFLIISTSSDNITFSEFVRFNGHNGSINWVNTFQSFIRFYFTTDNSVVFKGFHLTWIINTNISFSPSESIECQGPDILFMIDSSQAIFSDFFNNNIKEFIREVTSRFLFADDITPQRPFASKFGVILFSDSAVVSIPLSNYTRYQFWFSISQNATFGDGGTSNVTAALSLAYEEFKQHGTQDHGTFTATRVAVLIVNDISPFRLNQTVAAMKHLKEIVQLPIGVLVPGITGTPSDAQTHLTNLIGSSNYTFPSLDSAVIGIPALSSLKFPCPVCSNLVFICEMTAAIGWETKTKCLQLAQRLAAATSKTSKQKYGIGLYGVQIYNNITMQSFNDFNETISAMIDNVVNNNLPDGGQTYLTPILNQLYNMMGTDISSGNYAVLLMAQTSTIKDPPQAFAAARNVASRYADIYVLDESHYGPPSNLWGTLTQNQPYHVINGTVMTDIDELFITFDATLLQDYNNMHC